jgi:hypothetical protein
MGGSQPLYNGVLTIGVKKQPEQAPALKQIPIQ